MAGVLSLLRSALLRGDAVTVDDTAIALPDGTRLGRKEPTNFHSMRGRGDAYVLETVYFQFKHHALPYNEYVKECGKENVAHVTLLDKKDLVAYLKGEISECAGLVAPAGESAKTLKDHVGPSESVSAQKSADVSGVAAGAEASGKELGSSSPSRKRRRFESSGVTPSDVRELAMTARDQRGLDSVLCAEGWDFSGLDQKLSKQVARLREFGSRARAMNGGSRGSARGARDPKALDPRGDRYTTPDDRFWRENMGSDFYEMGIDPRKSFKSAGPKAGGDQGASSATSVGSGRSSGASTSQGTSSLASGSRADASRSRSSSRPENHYSSSHRAPSRPEGSRHAPTRDQIPIIIVPASTAKSSLLTILNAPEFLQNGAFLTASDIRERDDAPSGIVSRVSIRRKPAGNGAGRAAVYDIVSNPARLTDSEWNRVVACVCTGQAWQFKSWRDWSAEKGESGLVDIFRKMRGFVFHYDDESPPAATKKWGVRYVSLSRSRRHNDIKAQAEFWREVDSLCKYRKDLWY